MLVAVREERATRSSARSATTPSHVRFVDMRRSGATPRASFPRGASSSPSTPATSAPVRGIGEPVWPGAAKPSSRSAQRHESLLNVAFAYGPAWSLLCPYDLDELAPAADRGGPRDAPGADARRRQPSKRRLPAAAPRAERPSPARCPTRRATATSCRSPSAAWAPCAASCRRAPSAPGWPRKRAKTSCWRSTSWSPTACSTEAAADAAHLDRVRRARLRRARPRLHRRPARRAHRAAAGPARRRGLWLVNHLCDLVQIRSTPNGTIVRVRARLTPAANASSRRRPAAAAPCSCSSGLTPSSRASR